VGVSANGIKIGDKTFALATAPYLGIIVDSVLSPRETARLAGISAGPLEILLDVLRDWLRLMLGLAGIRKWPNVGGGAHLVFVDGVLWLCRERILFEDVFCRRSDTIRFLAKRVAIEFGAWNDVPVQMTMNELQIGDATFNPEAVSRMEVVTDAMVVPREAMGLGDVKFMAAIGAFLGWQAVVFSLMLSSVFGALVGVALIVMRRREWSSRLQYGPCIALAAAVWIFLPAHMRQDWTWNLREIGHLFFRIPLPASAPPEM
jgi:prepilin signal peptidase PulO-like enzyme (type II secretory pathway)